MTSAAGCSNDKSGHTSGSFAAHAVLQWCLLDATVAARSPALAPLRRPEVQQALAIAAAKCVADGCARCSDPRECHHGENLMSPVEFIEWLRAYLWPPELAELRPLSQDRRAVWARQQREKRRLERASAA